MRYLVHEYGGGSLCLHPDGSVVFSTDNGLFRQKENGDVEQLVDGKVGFIFEILTADVKYKPIAVVV